MYLWCPELAASYQVQCYVYPLEEEEEASSSELGGRPPTGNAYMCISESSHRLGQNRNIQYVK